MSNPLPGDECPLCEGVGMVQHTGLADVPHLVCCPRCDGTGLSERLLAMQEEEESWNA